MKKQPTKQKPMTLTDALRQALAESDKPLLTIANESGVVRQSIMRFQRGDQSLRLDAADRLAAYFGIQVVPPTTAATTPTPATRTTHRRRKTKGT